MSDVLKVSLQTTIYSLCNRGWSQRPLVTRSGYGGTAPACAFSTRRMEQVQIHARFKDGSVGMKFMTDDPSEAEEMREQWLAFDCVGEVLVSELPRWVRL